MTMKLEEAEIHSQVFKAMAHPTRVLIVNLLNKGEMSFGKIHSHFDLDKSTVSKHLSVLKHAGVVSSRKEGAETFYRLTLCCVENFFSCSTPLIKHSIRERGRHFK